ncbi:ABC transporter substrate-binding protein [Geodermatophilus sp. CPCC 206100]|uniref:ABC transporter substrate-binding protein n=1 Tax=Geodermatophilus sp. CPCC 206100 TaxID=3020054 RepID=UPI003AFF929F
MPRFRPAAALATAALFLAACGGDPDAGGSDSGSASGGAQELTTVTVADTAGAPLNFLTYGQREGYFEEAGLDLEISSSAGGATVIPQLIGGDLDVAGSNVVSVLVAAEQGLPLRMVAGGTSTSEEPEQDFSAIMVAGDSPITGIEQLAGQRVAVNTLRNINDIVIGSLLEDAGLAADSVQFVELPFPDMAPAVINGDVEAALLIEPFVTAAEQQGLKIVERPYTSAKPGLQIGTYVMSQQFVQENPEIAEAFLAGVQATADAIREDPEAFRTALPEISDISPELAADVRINLWQGASDRESLELIQELMLRYGLIEDEVDLDEVVVG